MGLEGVLGHRGLVGQGEGRVHLDLQGRKGVRDRKVVLGLKADRGRKGVQALAGVLVLGGVLGLVEGRVHLGLPDLLALQDPLDYLDQKDRLVPSD